jgi:predicted dehydrogenase
MTARVSLVVLGAGLIGKRHAEHILATPGAKLAGIVDPHPAGRAFSVSINVPWYESFAAMLENGAKPDGVVVATPNQLHVAHGMEAIAAGLPALIEKPIADTVTSAQTMVATADSANVPLLVGHHRRHNPMIQKAKAIIDAGTLGRILTVHGFFWLMKPDDYFEPAWRRERGAGPVFLNLIHDIDLLRYLCGEIVAVQAIESKAVRGNEVEETCVVLLKFASGALGTVNVSDCVVGPWSWEQTTGENPVYPQTDQPCYHIGGSDGAMTIPRLEVWSNVGKRGWWEPLHASRTFAPLQDPLRLQIEHFCRVIRGEEAPLVSGREGLKTLQVIEAVKTAAETGQAIQIG